MTWWHGGREGCGEEVLLTNVSMDHTHINQEECALLSLIQAKTTPQDGEPRFHGGHLGLLALVEAISLEPREAGKLENNASLILDSC